MSAFEFYGIGKIVFGRGTITRAGELASGFGKSPLLIHNSDAAVDRLLKSLTGFSITIRRQRGEPTVADIDAAIEQVRENKCDSVIGLGGGSAIDAAKATAGLLTNGGSAVDYMEIVGSGQKIKQPAAPWMAIPVTAGTGAEATRNAVIGLPEKRFKASIRSELLLPRIALIDPELAVTVPPSVTASSGMDCALPADRIVYIHRRVTTDGYPRASRHSPGRETSAEGFSRRNQSRSARGDGNGRAAQWDDANERRSRRRSWICRSIGRNFPAPHGTICAALLPHIIAANIRALREQPPAVRAPVLNRYANIGRQLPGLENATEIQTIDACVSFTADLLKEMHIPPLSQFGLSPADVPEMVALARKASSMRFNPVVLSDTALSAALIAAIR